MEIQEEKLVKKDVTIDVLCNKCAKSCKDYVDLKNNRYNLNYASITPSFGYGSVLYDMEDWEVHICETCYAEFEQTFILPPVKKLSELW